MIIRVKKRYQKEDVLDQLDPVIKEWFTNNFKDLTPAQAQAIPIIQQQKNVLVASPTGSGKTLTAFLMIINQLFNLGKHEKLENKVYCVYISPLKALANDIERNLNLPLAHIYELAKKHKINLPEIRVGVRTGDTSTSDRQKMTRKAPHILITTPETLSIIISTKKFRFKLHETQVVIIDEIHEICSSKRGVHLSISLERLQKQILTEGSGKQFIRIGLSATQAPITEIAKFLGGYDKNQKLREINLVEIPSEKELDLRVVCPVQDMNLIPFEIINAKMYEILFDLIKQHRTTLVFTNTRSSTENVAYKLHEAGLEKIAAHHGSLSKETRLEVETKLKNGELAATISSTSLELGIDIGYIDLVCQIGSPKSIAKGLQRIGRSGHALHQVSKGRIIVFDRDDLVECAVLVKNAYEGNIDRINILKNNLDVLAQALVGMSLEQRWEVDDAYNLIKQSYCYHTLAKRDFLNVMNYIGGKHPMEERGVYGKVRYYPDEMVFGIRRGARSIYNLNIGTIPQEAAYRVVILGTGYTVGMLSERFVEHLGNKDVFILGGKTYEYIQVKGMKVYVRDAHGRRPTVPSWTGEMLPRSFDLAVEIGRFREQLSKKILDARIRTNVNKNTRHNKGAVTKSNNALNAVNDFKGPIYSEEKIEQIENWLMDEYYLDVGSAKSIINYFIEQLGIIEQIPSNKCVVIEGYIDSQGLQNIIFHYCFGRRVNDALSRAYAYELSKRYRCTVRISLTDDNFMLTLPVKAGLTDLERLVTHNNLKDTLKSALKNTELFKQRFRHCAVRSFMILRNYKGKDISVRKQLRRSQKMLEILQLQEPQKLQKPFPVIKESYNEILFDVMDLKHAEEVQESIDNGKITVAFSGYSKVPSPFAHNVILVGISDIILMEDRSALLRELHQQVLNKVFSNLEVERPKFDSLEVDRYFKTKLPKISDSDNLIELLARAGPMRVFKERGKNIYDFIPKDVPRIQVQNWARELIESNKIVSIKRHNDTFWIVFEQLKYYLKLYSIDSKISQQVHQEVENNVSYDDALEFLILQYLKYYGPAPVQEIAYELELKDLEISKTINKLETTGQLASGNFIFGRSIPQYILPEDLSILELSSSKALEIIPKIDLRIVQHYLFNKMFNPVENIEEYFNRFGIAVSIREIYIRTKKFDLKSWEKLSTGKTGKLVFGRFLNGRVCYIPLKDVGLYVSAYREADLDNKELTVLNTIKKHHGINRKELSKKLHARQLDLKEIIDKLERNLYIIREPPELQISGAGVSGVANKYVFYDLKKPVKNSRFELVSRIINIFGPVSIYDIKSYTGFSISFIESCLEKLCNSGQVKRFQTTSEDQIALYIASNEYDQLENFQINQYQTQKNYVRILSLFDSYSIRSNLELRVKFGDGWFAPIFYLGKPIGLVDLWRLAGCIEVRDIQFDDILLEDISKIMFDLNPIGTGLKNKEDNFRLNLLRLVLNELENISNFYRLQGLDIIRIRKIFGHNCESISDEIKTVLLNSGYSKVQDFWVKGELDNSVFDPKETFNLTLERQHILPESRFVNPLRLIRSMGGVRSNYEMKLRLDAGFYDIKEFRKNLNLAAGPIIPSNYAYCTEKDMKIYKTAKARELDYFMEYVLENMPDDEPISSRQLFARLTLSKVQYNNARKKLYEGLHIIRTPMNKYIKVAKYRNLTKSYARKYVIKRIFHNFGIFNAETLSAFTKREYSMKELRQILRELESEGVITKGYFVKGDDTLYWILQKDLNKLKMGPRECREDQYYIISPHDQMANYLAATVKYQFGLSGCFIILNECNVIGAFKIKQKRKRVLITDFIGPDEAWGALEVFFRENKLDIIDKDAEELYTYDDL